ncbi:hypothetical protein [Corynebacterium sp.]|uniref:hypothetical protein n=1 Tax=Corynebacterium sp. TaxID=1720 RepID=UPI0027B9989B|nr:hypothetical protein [Corynebacterium sp.]
MSMQPSAQNPIERRKAAVRKYSKNGVISVGAGLGGGLLFAFLFSSSGFWLLLGFVVAVVGGVYNYNKVRKIINHRDSY